MARDILHVFHNERQAQFRELPLPANFPSVKALNVADVDNDGVLDLLAVQADGAIVRISDKHEGQTLDVAEIARVPAGAGGSDYLSGEVRLHVADLDNNGALDLFLTGASLDANGKLPGALIWLGDDRGKFVLLEHPFGQAAAPALVSDAADLSGDGRLDLLGLSCRRTTVAGHQSRIEKLSLAGGAAAREAGGWRPAHQSLWRGRRN